VRQVGISSACLHHVRRAPAHKGFTLTKAVMWVMTLLRAVMAAANCSLPGGRAQTFEEGIGSLTA